ncbi:MAG: AAA family ATPase [Pirellulales bacterium]
MISLKDVTSTGRGLPSRVIVYGPPGSGKTSLAARMPAPIVVQVGEDGLDDLIDGGGCPGVPHTPRVEDWSELITLLGSLHSTNHPYKTVVVDGLSGCEAICQAHVCKEEYGGRWEAPSGQDSFTAYGKGYGVTATRYWPDLLRVLDLLRTTKRMGILLLAHSAVKRRRRPDGNDIEAFVPLLHEATLERTTQWADCIALLNFKTVTTKQDGRTKGVGGQRRVLLTESRDWALAKSRLNLPATITLGESADEASTVFLQAFRDAKSKSRPKTQPQPETTEETP